MNENSKSIKAIESADVAYKSIGSTANKYVVFFEKICEQIAENIKKQLPVYEDVLLNFNKTVVALVSYNFAGGIASFEELSQLMGEYMRYGLESDSNKRRVYSYVRLSQMIDTFKTFQEGRNIEIDAHKVATEHPEYAKIIFKIKHSQDFILEFSSHTSKSRHLTDLLRKGFVIKGGTPNDNYYILSQTGDALFREMCFDGDYDWVDQWSAKRIAVLTYLLVMLRKYKSTLMVKDIAIYLSECTEGQINGLYEKAVMNRINTLPLFLSQNNLKSTISVTSYIIENNIQGLMDINHNPFEIPFSETEWQKEQYPKKQKRV